MGYRIKKRGKYYWLFGRIKGVRLDSSLRTTSKKEAEEIAKARVQKVLKRVHGIRGVKDIGFRALMEKYAEYCESNNRPSTYSKKQFNIANLVEHFGDVPVGAITPEQIEAFKRKRLRKVKPATVNRDLAALKHALRLAVKWGYLEASPADHVDGLREPPGRVRYLAPEEAEKLIGACSKWLRPLVIAALHTGMRQGELLALEWDDVDMKRRQIRVADSKTGDARVVPVNELLYNILEGLGSRKGKVFKNSRGKGYSWINSAFKNALVEAGIKEFRFHDLRHTFASWLAMEGVPLSTIGRLLGHKTAQMTMRYAHLAPDYLADVVEVLTRNAHGGETSEETESVTR
ncbi:MAG: tyrosine-type recombinase/integrase [Candidatus Zixiibacteriota bacterium]|jgi:integrase